MSTNARKSISKETRAWMREAGYTAKQLDEFWKDCYNTNRKVKILTDCGKSWRDMALSAVKELPTQKERDLAAIAEREAKERAEQEAKRKAEEEREYYRTHFEEIMVKKIDSGEKLSERELSNLVCGYEVESEYGENRRWTRTVETIVKLCGRFFCVCWEEGLTECQENEFWEQPVEVKKHTYEKVITVTEWVAV